MTSKMEEALSWDDSSLGMTARIQRVFRSQTQRDIAAMAGVSLKDIELFESNKRLSPTIMRKLLRAYDLIVETPSEKNSLN